MRAEREDLVGRTETGATGPSGGGSFEIVHRETAFGSLATIMMFIVNVLGVVLLAIVIFSMIQSAQRSPNPGAALLGGSALLVSVVTIWAGLAVICGAVRFFNRRSFLERR